MLIHDVLDPRLEGISIMAVKVDRELTNANIYVSALEGHIRKQEVLDGLEHAKGYLRSSLADRIELRIFPYLRFYWDSTLERAERIEQLFAQIKAIEAENISLKSEPPINESDTDTYPNQDGEKS